MYHFRFFCRAILGQNPHPCENLPLETETKLLARSAVPVGHIAEPGRLAFLDAFLMLQAIAQPGAKIKRI